MRHAESIEQQAVISWARWQPIARRIFAIPNGGKRNLREAVRFKAEGVMAGVPDLCLPVPIRPACGLYIEMKSKDGRLTPDQVRVQDELAGEGYCVVTAYSADAAITAIERYLNNYLGEGKFTFK